MEKIIMLDGTLEEQIASMKIFLGLSPEQDFSDLPDEEDEDNEDDEDDS